MKKNLIVFLCGLLLMMTACLITGKEVKAEVSEEGFVYDSYDDDTIRITDYQGNETNIVIPSEIDGYDVYEIGDNAFRNKDIESVIISEGIIRIGSNAFYNCDDLKSVDIPESVEEIGLGANNAFVDCDILEEIIIDEGNKYYVVNNNVLFDKNMTTLLFYPEGKDNVSYTVPAGVMTIGVYAFDGCEQLTQIILSETVNTISSGAFSGCTGLENIDLSSGLAVIGDFAFFNCTNLTSIDIPKTVTQIQESAFSNCMNLEKIILPEELVTLGINVFNDCTSLVSINWPEKIIKVPYGIFMGCDSLENVELPDSITEINNYAFYGCTSLKTIVLPKSLSSIGLDAFRECLGLRSITIPKNVQEMYQNIFKKCDNLVEIKVESGNKTYSSQDGVLFNKLTKTLISYPAGKANSVYTVPEGIVAIGDHAFHENVGNLKTVELPGSVQSIGIDTFYGDAISIENLKFFSRDCTISAADSWYEEFSIGEGITIYGYADSTAQAYAEKYERNFVELTENDKLTNPVIFNPQDNETSSTNDPVVQQPSGNGNSASTNKTSGATGSANQNTSIPSAGTTLNDSKTKATYTVTTAGAVVTYKAPANKKVKKVTIPSSVNINGITYKVTSVAPNAFKKCKKLKKVTIGAGVTEIGKNAFAGCKNLKNVIVKSKSLKKVGKNAFKGINKAAKIKVPKKQLKKYQKLFKKAKVAKSVKITK